MESNVTVLIVVVYSKHEVVLWMAPMEPCRSAASGTTRDAERQWCHLVMGFYLELLGAEQE